MKIRNSPTFHGASGYSSLRARNLTFKKVVKEVMRDRLNNRFMVQMENMMRRIVQEEFDRRIQPYLSSSLGPIERTRSETPSSRPQLKLRFINSPPSSIFTGSKIEAEDGSRIAIELVDATTTSRVSWGPFSSSRVELVPLDADFTEESWTIDVFKRNILKQREGKRSLLTGDLTVTLKNGVGVIAGDVAFTDNSSWTRSRKFRLGARLTGAGAVEARSEAFGCKDQRGESYRKHHPPCPNDDVWRLERIAKDGVSAMRLGEREIFTVKDFRRWHAMDPNGLYSIIGSSTPNGGISRKTWDVIVSHAMECVLDETECYIYHANAHGVSLLFNSVYEVIKVSFNGAPFRDVDQLVSYEPCLNQLKVEAYQNLNCFIPVNGRTFSDHQQRSLHFPQNSGFGIACPGSQHMGFQGTLDSSDSSMSLHFTASGSTVQPEMLMNFDNPPAATFHIDEKFLPTLRNSFRATPVHDESQSVLRRDYIENEEEDNAIAYHHHHDIPLNWSPGTAQWAEQNYESLCVSVSGTEETGMFDVRIANIVGSPRARWCKVKAAFKLREVWRNTTARNRGKTCKKPCLPY